MASKFSETQLKRLGRQVNWYCSDKNLANDEFFRSFVKDGKLTVPLVSIASCPKVQAITKDHDIIKAAVGTSGLVALSEDGASVERTVTTDDKATYEEETDTVLLKVSNIPSSAHWKPLYQVCDTLANVVVTLLPQQRRGAGPKRTRDAPKRTRDGETKDTAPPSAKKTRTSEAGDKADAPAAEAEAEAPAAADPTPAPAAAAGAGGAGSATGAAEEDTLTGHIVVNCPGEKPEDVLAEYNAAQLKLHGQVLAFELEADAETWWVKRKAFMKKKNQGRPDRKAPKDRKKKDISRIPEDFVLPLAGKDFAGYASLAEVCTTVIKTNSAGVPLTGDRAAQMKELLCYHPSAAEKLADAAALTTGPSEEFADTACMKVVTKDGKVMDWSWRKAVYNAHATGKKPVVDPATVSFEEPSAAPDAPKAAE